ncbi:MAG TPA: GNAT family N-acetyltransferase [Terracidiphilus sp.]|jgi:putative acetyltransferase|nr:GNAT family N-acetyltransferase [Terracidiphilus sp.]
MAASSSESPHILAETRIEELQKTTPEDVLRSARELLLEYGAFVMGLPGAGRFCFGTLQQEADNLPQSFIEQGGGSLVAFAHGEPVGFVAWRALTNAEVEPDSWELKRLWVRPAGRGIKLGRMLTQAVLDRAIIARRKAVYLDTAPESMSNAHRLYLDLGFHPCNSYNDNPVEGLEWLVKFI